MGGPRDFAAIREGLEEDAQAGDQAVMDLWTVVEKASGQVIGHCGLLEKDVDDQAEIELIYVFASDCWGKGYATEAALALRDHAFHRLELRRIIALIDPGNPASVRVAEKIGMQLEGGDSSLKREDHERLFDPLPRTRFQSRIGHLSVLPHNSTMMQDDTA